MVLEQRLYHGPFGKYNRYRCLCLKRNARTAAEKLGIAQEVMVGPGVNTMEAQYNELYIREHETRQQVIISRPRAPTPANPDTQAERSKQA